MKNINSFYTLASVCIASFFFWSCERAGGEFQGTEFMPDMAHSIAYEANYNTYYYNNTWGEATDYRMMAGPRKPVEGTIARGYMPHKYASIEDFRESPSESSAELQGKALKMALTDFALVNPIKPTSKEDYEKMLVRGEGLYNVSCSVCHGLEGDGNGPIFDSGNGPYVAAPANYLKDNYIAAPDAVFYNVIMNGKGRMQPHADKLNEQERWEVIHYIRYLQAESKGEDYYNKITSPVVSVAVDSLPVDILVEEVHGH